MPEIQPNTQRRWMSLEFLEANLDCSNRQQGVVVVTSLQPTHESITSPASNPYSHSQKSTLQLIPVGNAIIKFRGTQEHQRKARPHTGIPAQARSRSLNQVKAEWRVQRYDVTKAPKSIPERRMGARGVRALELSATNTTTARPSAGGSIELSVTME